MTAADGQGPELPVEVAQLQSQVETLFMERIALERELTMLRALPPVVLTRPKRPVLALRALMRVIPRLRRRYHLRLIRTCGLFDEAWYRARYPDITDDVDAARHFLLHGAGENRDPGPSFSTQHYLGMYPDIANSSLNPLVHYVTNGADEGRAIRPGMTHGERS